MVTNQDKWDEITNEVQNKHITEGVLLTTVVGIRMHNIPVRWTSWGDFQREIYGPSIDLALPDTEAIVKEFTEVWNKAHDAQRALRHESDMSKRNDKEVQGLMQKAHQKRTEMIVMSAKTIGIPLFNMLEGFYKKNKPKYDVQLILKEQGFSGYRLESNGVSLQAGRNLKQQEKCLEIYRRELIDFGDYLKNSFLDK